jgi:hypothetical protein
MFAKQNELKDAARHFQLELPFMEFIFDQACETLCSRVIRICDYYFPSFHEQQAQSTTRRMASNRDITH